MKKAVLLALLLGGCDVTASQERATAERIDNETCSSYGLKYGSTEYAQCRASRDQQRQSRELAVFDQINRNNRQNIENLEFQERQLRPAVNCTGTTFGNTINTTCR